MHHESGMALFTTENAAIMGKQGAIARWTKPDKPAFDPSIAEPTPKDAAMARAWVQMEHLNDLLDDCTDAKEQDALTRAKERQFRIWARLAQLPSDPKPMQLKQPARAQTWSEPTPVQPSTQPKPEQSQPGPGFGQASG